MVFQCVRQKYVAFRSDHCDSATLATNHVNRPHRFVAAPLQDGQLSVVVSVERGAICKRDPVSVQVQVVDLDGVLGQWQDDVGVPSFSKTFFSCGVCAHPLFLTGDPRDPTVYSTLSRG